MGNPQPRAELYVVHEEPEEDLKVPARIAAKHHADDDVEHLEALDSGQQRLQALGCALRKSFRIAARTAAMQAAHAAAGGSLGCAWQPAALLCSSLHDADTSPVSCGRQQLVRSLCAWQNKA